MKYTQADVTFKLGNRTLIINKDDFELVSSFPFLLAHPVYNPERNTNYNTKIKPVLRIHLILMRSGSWIRPEKNGS